jgi:hypothetical protein
MAGVTSRRRADRAREARDCEREAKAATRARDGGVCQWPGCTRSEFDPWVEVAHVKSRGSGGASETRNLLCLCADHHRGRRSLHSGHLQVRAKDAPLGMNDKRNRVFVSREQVGFHDPFVDLPGSG